jgi:hypothetical protein
MELSASAGHPSRTSARSLRASGSLSQSNGRLPSFRNSVHFPEPIQGIARLPAVLNGSRNWLSANRSRRFPWIPSFADACRPLSLRTRDAARHTDTRPGGACGVAAGLSSRRSRVRIPPRILTIGQVVERQTRQVENLVPTGREGSSPSLATCGRVAEPADAAVLKAAALVA